MESASSVVCGISVQDCFLHSASYSLHMTSFALCERLHTLMIQ